MDGRQVEFEFESRYCQNSSLLHVVQTGSEPHPAYPIGTGGYFHWGRAAGARSWHSLPATAQVKNTWIYVYTSTPPYVFVELNTGTTLPLPSLRILWLKRDDLRRGWRKLYNDRLLNLYPSSIIRMIKSRGDEMGKACSTHRAEDGS
jgi:hypothetical protein